MKKNITFLLTCGGAGGTPGNVTFLQNLNKYDAKIIVADSNAASGNLFNSSIDAAYEIPGCDSKEYIDAISELILKEKVDYLYSGLDEEILILSKNKKKLNQNGCQILLPEYESLLSVYDKKVFYEKYKDVIRMPSTITLNENIVCSDIWQEYDGNVIIKITKGRGGRSIFIPKNFDEFEFLVEDILKNKSKFDEYIIQKRIVGEEWGVTTLHQKSGERIFSVCRRKYDNKDIITNTVIAAIEENVNVIDYVNDLIKITNLEYGLNSTEVRLSEEDGLPYVIEVNGGRCAAHDINLYGAGINVMELLVDILNEKSIEPIKHPEKEIVSLRKSDYVLVTRNQINSMKSFRKNKSTII